MANGFSPYQVAAPTVNLIGQTGIKKKKEQETALETALTMNKMEEEFQKEMDALGLQASEKEAGSKGTQNLELGTKLGSLFLNPILAGLLGGIVGSKKHRRARKARKGLLNLRDKWSNTFLRKGARDYMSEAEGLQLDKGGDLIAGLTDAVKSGLSARMLGGKIGEGEFMSKFGSGEGALSKLGDGGFFKNMRLDGLLGRDLKNPLDNFGYGIDSEFGDMPGFFSKSLLKADNLKSALAIPSFLQLLLSEQDY